MSKIVPSPTTFPQVGTLISLLKEGGGSQLHNYVTKMHKELGPIFKDSIGPVEAYFLNHPHDMRKVFAAEGMYPVHILPECWVKYNDLYGCKRGLYFMDGPEWLKNRKIMNKYLLKNFSSQSEFDTTRELFKSFEQKIVSSSKLNGFHLEPHLYQLSINFIIAHMLGTPFISHHKSLSNEITELSKVVHKIFDYSVALSLLPINLSIEQKHPAWTGFVETVTQSLNLASVLCDKMEKVNGNGLMAILREESLSTDLIKRIVIDFILAAGDTVRHEHFLYQDLANKYTILFTALSTQWIFYLLGRHPHNQVQLREELLKQDPSKSLDDDTLNHIIRESLRLYPVAPFLSRFIPQDIVIRDYLIPKDSLVLLSIYSSSHDPAFFPSPEEFQPQRWSRDPNRKYKNVREPYASIPYAMGARSCIGRKLAHTLMCWTVDQIIRNHKIEVKTPVDVVLKLITVPSEPIQFEFTPWK